MSYVIVIRGFSGGVNDNTDAVASVRKVLEEVSTAYTRFVECVFMFDRFSYHSPECRPENNCCCHSAWMIRLGSVSRRVLGCRRMLRVAALEGDLYMAVCL